MKKKTNKLLYVLLIVILAFTLAALAACQPPEDDDGDDPSKTPAVTDTAIVKNGRFANASNSDNSNAYVKDSVANWTPASGVTSYTSAKVGVIDLKPDTFNANKDAVYADMDYPGIAPNTPKENGDYTDTNALVISSVNNEGSLYYKSAAITLAKKKYYKLTIDVYTDLIIDDQNNKDLKGVWIYINTGAYAEFQAINTEKGWKTFTLYIEANNAADRTMYIQLWLGYGPKYMGSSGSSDKKDNPRMTKGVALFDNIVMSPIEKTEYDAVYNDTQRNGYPREVTVVSDTKNNDTAIISLIYPDSNFSYVADFSTTSSSSTKSYFSAKVGIPNSNNYSGQIGKDGIENTEDFNPSKYTTNYSTVGIFDMSKLFAPLYNEDGSFKNEYSDTFRTINTDFVAPKIGDQYQYSDFMDGENFRLNGRSDAKDPYALLIYHPDYSISGYGYKSKNTLLIEKNKYYEISVWVYVWTPEYGKTAVNEPTRPEGEDPRMEPEPKMEDFEDEAEYNTKKQIYDKNKSDWEKYDKDLKTYQDYIAAKELYEGDARDRAQAIFRLTGATIEEGELETKSTKGLTGQWEKLTIKVRGNELSDRSVNLEFWYGEGNWGDDTLMPGGCLFDDVTIRVLDPEKVTDPSSYDVLSPLEAKDYEPFGLMDENAANYTELNDVGVWQHSFEDSRTSRKAGDAAIINGAVADSDTLWASIDKLKDYQKPGALYLMDMDGNNKKLFNLVMLRNNIYTASILKYIPDEENKLVIAPNAFYRLSMWVKTDDIDDDMGLDIALLRKDGDSQLTSLSKINANNEWTEVVFYLQGSSDDPAEFYLKFTLGSGDNYTPANHIKGTVYLSAFTYKKIAYSEYNTTSSDKYSTKYSVPSSTTAKDTISNGWFTNLDTATFTSENKDIFDEDDGSLIGVAIPSSWTAKAAESGLTQKPKDVKLDGTVLSWKKGSDFDEMYFIYVDNLKVPDDKNPGKTKTINNYYMDRVLRNNNDEFTYDLNDAGNKAADEFGVSIAIKGATYKVRAVSSTRGFSDFATASRTYDGDDINKELYNAENINKNMPKAGVIDYTKYEAITDNYSGYSFYTGNSDPSAVTKGGEAVYVSQYNKLLMVSSQYPTRMGYLSPSTGSLTSNAYYMISVWVRTEPGSLASVTINNKSNVITYAPVEEDNNDYIGFVNIDTNGEWEQIVFYIQTTKMSSPAGLQLELYLGNKYAKPEKIGTDEYKKGLSKGTVYFDDITFKKLESEAEYNRLAYGSEKPEDGDLEENTYYILKDNVPSNLFVNKYIFKRVDLTTDSFDSYTEGTDPLGGTPGAYTHYNVQNAKGYNSSDDVPAMLYGVYDKRDVWEKIGDDLTDPYAMKLFQLFGDSGEANDAVMRSFLTENVGTGNHYLLLVNLVDNGQYYLTSDTFSLNSNTYYKISFWAKVKAPEGKKAEFRFEYGNATDRWSTVYIDSEEWTEYTFYIYNGDTSSVSNNKFAFYLGSNESKVEGDNLEDMFAGMLIIDDVTFVPLSSDEEYTAKVAEYEAMSDEQKAAASFGYYKFEKAEPTPGDDDDDDGKDDEDRKNQINSQLWLLISSIVIGALLIAVIVVLIWRTVKKRIKRNIPVKVMSNVPVNLETKHERKAKTTKKDLPTDDYTD